MRVFIAVEIDEEVKNELARVQKNLGMFVSRGNYTDRNNFHVTLRFIGDADEKEINRLKQVVDASCLESRTI
ncbi:MAG: 2'-5' RNA ligase family protein [Alkalibacterium sp.]|nr:2'-5' RNA ligase family protein [Alkalibacterium sp.]